MPHSTNLDAPEDRRKHLEFIQATIGRMSAASTLVKGWCLTVSAATFSYSLTKTAPAVSVVGLAAVVLFGMLDARYLREERRYRSLYEDARRGSVQVYDMRAGDYGDRTCDRFDPRCAWRAVVKSWSLWGFYGPIASVGTFAGLRALVS